MQQGRWGTALGLVAAAATVAATGLGPVTLSWTLVLLALIFLALSLLVFRKAKPPVDPLGKAVVISGCDSGFGHALAWELGRRGFHVFAGCLDPEGSGAKALASQSRITTFQLDVTSSESIEKAKRFVLENLGSEVLWAVVNNAGVTVAGEVEWCDISQAQHIFDVNVFGPLRLTKAFLSLIRQNQGRVVNVSSYTSVRPCPGCVFYCMTKSAVRSFSIGLRLEMRKWGVKVIDIEPWVYRTRITTEEGIKKEINKTWKLCPDDVKAAYGEKYLDKFEKAVKMFASSGEISIEPVVSALVEAVAGGSPKPIYEVMSWTWALRFFLLHLLPANYQDYLILWNSHMLVRRKK